MEGTALWDAPFNYPALTQEVIQNYLSGDIKSHYEATWVSDTGQKHLIEWDVTLLRDLNNNVEFVIMVKKHIFQWCIN